MRKLYQTNWFDISFNEFTKMSSTAMADKPFYDAFYDIFHQRYRSFSDLPQKWKEDKSVLARHLATLILPNDKVLSVGCGSGFIEDKIVNALRIKLTAIEPSHNASSWIQSNESIELLHGYFPDVLPKNRQYDLIYSSYIDYVFDSDTYDAYLKSAFGRTSRDFILLGVSIYQPGLLSNLKALTKNILNALGLYPRQFWGYQRTLEEHLQALKKAGFEHISYGKLENGAAWLKGSHA